MSIVYLHKASYCLVVIILLSAVSCKDKDTAVVGPVEAMAPHTSEEDTIVKVQPAVVSTPIDTVTRQVDKIAEAPIKKQTVKPTRKKEVAKPTPPPAPKKKVKKKPKKKRIGKFSFENDELDFGTIKSGDIIEHSFTFVNEGDKALTIKDADVTCGCTYPSFPFLPIAPGESGVIKVRYNSVGKEGKQEAKVTINSDADKSPYYLYLRGTVVMDSIPPVTKIDSTTVE
jgi:hypothetical protein